MKNQIKARSIFDFIKDLTKNKTPWESLTETDQKNFSIYMINRWLSMNIDLITIINFIQQFNLYMDKREAYKLYLDLLPKMNIYLKYISKDKTEKDKKYNNTLVEFIANQENWSTIEAEENLNLLLNTMSLSDFNNLIVSYVGLYGITDKEANSKFGIDPF